MVDELHIAVSIFSLIGSMLLILFTISIGKMFKGLPRLERPWNAMLGAILLFVLLQIADIMRTIEGDPRLLLGLIHDFAAIGFVVFLGYALYLFKVGWTVPKA